MVETLCFQGKRRDFCHAAFLFHQLIQRDKAQPVVLDVDVLHPLPAEKNADNHQSVAAGILLGCFLADIG